VTTVACQPILGGSHVDEFDRSAYEQEAICAAAHQRLSHGGCSCDDSEELAGLDGDIDMEDDAVDTTPEKA